MKLCNLVTICALKGVGFLKHSVTISASGLSEACILSRTVLPGIASGPKTRQNGVRSKNVTSDLVMHLPLDGDGLSTLLGIQMIWLPECKS